LLKNTKLPQISNEDHKAKVRKLLEDKINEKKGRHGYLSIKNFAFAAVFIGITFFVFGYLSQSFFADFKNLRVSSNGVFIKNGKSAASGESFYFKKNDTIVALEKTELFTEHNTNLEIFKGSEIVIAEYGYKNGDLYSIIKLQKGKIKCTVTLPTPKSLFKIVTEQCSVVVTGTIFSVEILSDKNVKVEVDEGKVSLLYDLYPTLKSNILKNEQNKVVISEDKFFIFDTTLFSKIKSILDNGENPDSIKDEFEYLINNFYESKPPDSDENKESVSVLQGVKKETYDDKSLSDTTNDVLMNNPIKQKKANKRVLPTE